MPELLNNEKVRGWMCPSCKMFSDVIEEISHHDGTCANCAEYFVMWIDLIPLNINGEPYND